MSITQVWLTISGWMSQLGVIKRADQLEAGVQLLLRPAGQVAVEPADAGGIGNQAVLPLDAPCCAHHSPNRRTNASGISRGSVFQGCVILVGENLVELRDAEVSQVDQAGRVVDDQADGHATARVDDRDTGRRFRRP